MPTIVKSQPEIKWSTWLAFLSVLLLFSSVSVLRAQELQQSSLKKVKIAYSSISGTMAPLWATYEAGIFRRHGLDVELVFIEGGSAAVEALAASKVLVAQVGGAGVLRANLKGSDTVMIAGVLNTMPYQFIVSKNIKQPEQLKGTAVAVSRFGGSSDFATRYALEKFELVPQRDVTILEIGSQPARIAALKEGKIQGTMLSIPETLAAKKMGFSSLADLKMLGLEYQHTGLATTRGVIEGHRDTLQKVMRAYVEGIHYYKTHRDEALQILQKYLKSDNLEDLSETYEVLALTLLPEKPYPTVRGIQLMLQQLAEKNPKAKTARPEQFVDTSFVSELDRSGSIDDLYKKGLATLTDRREPLPTPAATSVIKEAKPDPAEMTILQEPSTDKNDKGQEPNPVSEIVKTARQQSKTRDRDPETKAAQATARAPQSRGDENEMEKPLLHVAKSVNQQSAVSDTNQVDGTSGARIHTVTAGDTLSHLAMRYYRDAATSKWMRIYEANRQSIKNPHYIYIGQKILIPPNEQASS